uniref:t-SNARE coiled-coil homology domain-containing protein n=1 Tax=Wuchereria bancrofti TaxID=6293 RepID=A0AAF5RVL9_WUCBA
MPVDKTPLFRAQVKMIRTQETVRLKRTQMQKQQHQQQQQTENSHSSFEEKLEKASSRSLLNLSFLSCTVEAQRIRRELIALRNIVISGRKNYVSDIGHSRRLIASYTDSMNDFERDELDAKIKEMMQDCIQSIQALQLKISSSNLRAFDEGPHLFQVLRMLGKHLKGTAKIVAEMRALRTKKISSTMRTCRLATLAQLYNMKKQRDELLMANGNSVETKSLKSDISSVSDSVLNDAIMFGKDGLRKRVPQNMKKSEIRKLEQDGWSDVQVSDFQEVEQADDVDSLNNLDDDERAQLMIENERLYSQSLQVDNDIQKVEKQMAELYQLQATFAEKVSEQERDINVVNETTLLTVENIRIGNEQIRQAIQNMASRRVILLFCIIVLTFTLLFLDWYNP